MVIWEARPDGRGGEDANTRTSAHTLQGPYQWFHRRPVDFNMEDYPALVVQAAVPGLLQKHIHLPTTDTPMALAPLPTTVRRYCGILRNDVCAPILPTITGMSVNSS